MEKEHKARPIIFQGWGVRAIMEGRKTQTRRVMNRQPHPDFLKRGLVEATPQKDGVRFFMADGMSELVKCPFGVPGDHLYVRETWAVSTAYDSYHGSLSRHVHNVAYRAGGGFNFEFNDRGRWRPSIHMPRWASRLTLEITEVRVQRLQDISEEDAKAEGVERKLLYDPANPDTVAYSYRMTFADLWDDINGKKFPWSGNFWVWAISFRRI